MSLFPRRLGLLLISLTLMGASACERGGSSDVERAPAGDMQALQPDELARRLAQPGDPPLLLHVGYAKLYQQAHIPGSEYVGPTDTPEGLERLRARVTDLPRDTEVVVYCGCCPWERCPNMEPASGALRELGFTEARVLYIAKDFGANWVAQGYPVAKGQ